MRTDVLIVGGGPAGSAAAMFLLREGIQPVIVEAEEFPRYHIGESLTGGAADILRELGLEAEMGRNDFLVKHGVKVYGQSANGSWFVPVRGRDANWEPVDQTTWQVRRSVFDNMMLDIAVERGARRVCGKALRPIVEDGVVKGAHIQTSNGVQEIRSEMLLDCSGQATWLANFGGVTGPKYVGAYDKQIALFSQVRGPIRDQGTTRDQKRDNTLIFYQRKYHWSWFIPLDQDTVSIGVVVPSAYFLEKRESTRDFLIREMHDLHPELKRRLPRIELVEDVHVIPNYSFQVKDFCGKGFLCLGDAHRFVDPIFSFGVSLALHEAKLAAPQIRAYLNGEGRDAANPFASYQLYVEKGIDVLEDMLDGFWEQPMAFSLCVHHRYRDLMTDIFAGRVYEHQCQPTAAVTEFRELLGRKEERERSYLNDEAYSIPIGSRFHPERAALWDAESPVEATELWMERKKTALQSRAIGQG